MLKRIDGIAGLIFVSALKRAKKGTLLGKEKNPKKILVIRFSAIGESLLALPMVKALLENGHEVNGFALRKRARVVFENCGLFKKVLGPADLPSLYQKYDIAIDCEPFTSFSAVVARLAAKTTIGFAGLKRDSLYDYKIRYNDRQHVVKTFCDLLRPLGIEKNPARLEPLVYGEKTEKKINEFLGPYRKKYRKLLGIYCSSEHSVPERRWDRYGELIPEILKKYPDACIFLTGAGKIDERANADLLEDLRAKERVVDTCNMFSFKEFACFLKQLDIYVSNDSGPMHVAAAMGTKTIGLFGPETPVRFAPFGKGNIGICKCGPDYRPAINVHKGEYRRDAETAELVKRISVKDVMKEIDARI